jgi:hypothetical protein
VRAHRERAAVVLAPAPDRLKGSMATTAPTKSGKQCPVTFQWDVVACTPERITVKSEQEFGLAEDCSRLPGEAPDLADNVLVRVK